jgi:hypothetical protein
MPARDAARTVRGERTRAIVAVSICGSSEKTTSVLGSTKNPITSTIRIVPANPRTISIV